MKNKTNTRLFSLAAFGLAIFVPSHARDVSLIDEDINVPIHSEIGNALSVDVEKSWWHEHYVNGLGLAPFTTGIKPMPVVRNQKDKHQDLSPILGYYGGKLKVLKDAKDIEANLYYPLSDVIPVRENGEHLSGHPFIPLVFFRVQDDLNSKPFDAQPGSVVWTNDREAGGESTMINAALLVDMYFSGVGKVPGKGFNFFGFSSDNMFHLLLGAEVERFDSGGASAEVDIRRYSALMEFSPGALFNLPSVSGDAGKARQTMTLGWTFEDDAIQDAHRHSLQLRYAPVFNLLGSDMFIGARSYFKKLADFYSEDEIQRNLEGEKVAKVATSGMSSAVVQADKANAAVGTGKQPFNSYFYLRPKVGLEYGSVSASSVLSGQVPDLALNYLIETGISFAKESAQIGYRLNGVSGIGSKGTHMVHEFFAQVTPHGWPGRIFCTYKSGEVAPSFVDIDVLQVGLGVKF